MARKSRKNLEAAPKQDIKRKVFDVGAYVRLSAEDRMKKGDSIETQQAIINAYIAEHSDLELREVYIDTVSGQTFGRPSFQQMLEDFESGKITCCVTKDLSRLGRNAIDTSFYIEKYFPEKKIRFIAINDDYDSEVNDSAGIVVNLKNIVNETYALEIGRKIRDTKQMNIRNGCYVGRIPPYGYLKSSEDKHKLVPDEYASAIVQRIFEMRADGKSIKEILNWLIIENVMPPKRYFHSIGLIGEKEATGHIHWNRAVIFAMLHNRIYCGDMVQGKGRTYSYVREKVPQSEWVITENTHKGIISRELFAEVQKRRTENSLDKSTIRPRVEVSENIFLRIIFCGHCGYTMRRTKSGKSQAIFLCTTRHSYGADDCSLVSINENSLKEKLLADIKNEAKTFDNSKKASVLAAKEYEADKRELHEVQTDIEANEKYFKSLFETFASCDLNNDEYSRLKQYYGAKIEELKEQEKNLQNNIRCRHIQTATRAKIAESFKSVKRMNDITAELVKVLIKKIVVFEDKEIEVHYKYKDKIKAGYSANHIESE